MLISSIISTRSSIGEALISALAPQLTWSLWSSYVREKRGRLLAECADKIQHYEGEITEFGIKIESVRETVAKIDREINESGSLISRLRDNIRMRRVVKDIEATQAEIDSYDMEGAAKAKRTFEDRYQVEKQRETEMQSKVSRVPSFNDALYITHLTGGSFFSMHTLVVKSAPITRHCDKWRKTCGITRTSTNGIPINLLR